MPDFEKQAYDRESEYFAKQDAIAKAKIRDKAKSAGEKMRARQALGEQVGSNVEELVELLEQSGFHPDTVRVLDLAPLLHVAWADGEIQKSEREAIHNLMKTRGLKAEDEAWKMVDMWMDVQPTGEFFDNVLKVIFQLYKSKGKSPNDIVDMAVQIAESSGGFFGLGKISEAERDAIERIAEKLGKAAEEELKRELH